MRDASRDGLGRSGLELGPPMAGVRWAEDAGAAGLAVAMAEARHGTALHGVLVAVEALHQSLEDELLEPLSLLLVELPLSLLDE